MAEFRTALAKSSVAPGTMKVVEIDGREIAVANVGGTCYAFGNLCTHDEGPLGEGDLEGTVVTCPWHMTQFDVRTGAVVEGLTDEPVPVYEVREDGDEVLIRVP